MSNHGPNPRAIIGIGVFLLILYLIGYSIFAAMYTIQSGTVGVLVTFGRYSEEVKLPGLHFKVPFIQDVKVFDIKLQTANYLGQGGYEEDGVSNVRRIEVMDNKNLPIGIDMSVQYTPIPDEANMILEKYGRNYFQKLINPIIRKVARDVIGKYQAEEIASKRSQIGVELKVQLSEDFQASAPYFLLNNINLREIKLPSMVIKKIEEVQLAKQEEQRLTMVEQQAKKSQEIKTIEANTKLIEVTTQAKADAEKKRIAADAKAYQIMAEARAVAEANKLIATSITQELIDYRSIERWSGQYPQTLIGGGEQSGLIFSLPNTAVK